MSSTVYLRRIPAFLKFSLCDYCFASFRFYALLPVLLTFGGAGRILGGSFMRQTLLVFFAAMSAVSLMGLLFCAGVVVFVAPVFAADPASFAQPG